MKRKRKMKKLLEDASWTTSVLLSHILLKIIIETMVVLDVSSKTRRSKDKDERNLAHFGFIGVVGQWKGHLQK